jgi:hypothetical protein
MPPRFPKGEDEVGSCQGTCRITVSGSGFVSTVMICPKCNRGMERLLLDFFLDTNQMLVKAYCPNCDDWFKKIYGLQEVE